MSMDETNDEFMSENGSVQFHDIISESKELLDSPEHASVAGQTFDVPDFEKSAIKFNFNKTSEYMNDDIKVLADDIQAKLEQAASTLLYHWQYVPIVFPPSLVGLDKNETASSLNCNQINYNNLFKAPTFDELDKLAFDASGKQKKLSKLQFDQLQKNGYFEVESMRFPGKYHKWKLTRWLQKGYLVSNASFFLDMSKALKLIIVTARNRFTANCFSILQAMRSWRYGVKRIFDICFGLSEMEVIDFDEKLTDQMQAFIVSELKVDPICQDQYERLCKLIKQATTDEEFKFNEMPLPTPYYYLTPTNLKIDFRLFDKELFKKLTPILKIILKNTDEQTSYLNKRREISILHLRNEGLSDQMIAKSTSDLLMDEYMKRVFQDILNSKLLENISPGIGKLLCDHAKSVIIMQKVCDELKNQLNEHLKTYEENLKKNHKFKSLIGQWLSKQLKDERTKFMNDNAEMAHKKSMIKCRENELLQTEYFISRELEFFNEHEQNLIDKYKKEKEPRRKFSFKRMIWLPKNYIIEKIELPNESNTQRKTNYHLKKSIEYESSTRYPFWRWKNFFLRTWVYLCNSLFIFGLVIPFASKFSLRALFSYEPFFPGKIVDQNTGELVDDPGSKTLTFMSRLMAIWKHVSKSRNEFEQTPDKGLIGKQIQRFFNRFWNYVVKGALGSIGLALTFPLLCLIISFGSLTLALLTPIWYPIISILHHLCFFFIYDWDYPYVSFKFAGRVLPIFDAIFFRIITFGILMPAAALLTALIACPLGSIIIAAYAVLRKASRKTWDSLMFYLLLKGRARVPSSNSFFAKRTAGPGLASDYFFQIKPEQALAALEAHLETKILNAYVSSVERKLNEPIRLYSKFFNPIFQPFSYTINSAIPNSPFTRLNTEISNTMSRYRQELNRRQQLIDKMKSNANLSKIRLNEADLKVLICEATQMVRHHYENSILPYENRSAKEFFNQSGLNEHDWQSFTGSILESIFSTGILTPLEDTHSYFSLEIDHLNLAKYTSMIANSELRDDLDLVIINYNPKKGTIPVVIPNKQDVSIFCPTNQNSKNYHYSYSNSSKRFLDLNLQIPTNLPRELYLIALVTYNNQNKAHPIEFKVFSEISQTLRIKNKASSTRARKLQEIAEII